MGFPAVMAQAEKGRIETMRIIPFLGAVLVVSTCSISSAGQNALIGNFNAGKARAADGDNAEFAQVPQDFGSFKVELGLVTASSVYDEAYRPEFALDGDSQTRWASRAGAPFPAWLQIDLGSAMTFDRLAIDWEVACATEYEIQSSVDGTAWKTILHKADGQAGKIELSGLAARGRYVRITALKPKDYSHVSIWEVSFPESHVAAALASARRAAAEKRARQMRETLAHVGRSGDKEIVFAARPVVGEHWYANFGYYAASSDKPYFGTNKLYRDGAKLYRLNLADKRLATLLDDPQGGIRDPQVHYDGGKILFAYRKGGTENYHLYEINCDGSGLRQLTDGPFDDIEPSYLPDGGIVFVSSRARRWVNCWTTPVAVLHRCDGDGRNIRDISSNNEHDNTPWPLPDGRILYTRWEYVDRSQVNYHHLWTANPDGTGQTVYFGNLHPGVVMIDAKPIPGSEQGRSLVFARPRTDGTRRLDRGCGSQSRPRRTTLRPAYHCRRGFSRPLGVVRKLFPRGAGWFHRHGGWERKRVAVVHASSRRHQGRFARA